MTPLKVTATALAVVALLAGCGDEHQELRSWMDDQRAKMPVATNALQPPKQFEPFRYAAADQVDPFSATRIAIKAGGAPSSGPKPDMTRRREALESFPLESIRMVGHLTIGGNGFALLQAGATVFQARVGNYVGQNFGVITQVTETEVALKELLQDATGDWVPREAALRLQESKK